MQYNFDEIIDRNNSNCQKYDNREMIFGSSDVLPMWVADTDFRTPPFIVEAVKKRASHEVYGYPLKPESFYKAIAQWLKRRHNWEIDTKWIMYSPNVVTGLASLVLSLTSPGDKIIVQPPVYFPFFDVVKGNGRIVQENPLVNRDGRYYFDFDNLKSNIDSSTKMLLLCSPHNPGGMVWTKDELTELGNICIENDIIVVADEIHADLVLPGYKHVAFASISDEFSKQCITTMSASKTFNMAGLASSFLISRNSRYRREYERFMRATHISSGNFFGLVATEAAFTHGDTWLNELMVYLEGNIALIDSFIKDRLPALKVMKPEGTYLLWIDLSGLTIPAKEAFQKLIDAGLGLSPGYLFGTGGEDFVRLNMGCPQEVIVNALNIMEKALAAYQD